MQGFLTTREIGADYNVGFRAKLMDASWGSELGYVQKPGEKTSIDPDKGPEILRRALFDSEKEAFELLSGQRL